MEALYFETSGSTKDVLQLGSFPIPQPGENEVLIKVLASAINPADFLFIEGRYRFQPDFPQIAGLEGTGIVERAGGYVDLAEGTLVSFRTKNTWAEYVVVPREQLYVLPKSFPLDKAAQFALNPVTAWALLEEAQVKPGDWLLVTAGNSAVARLVVQLAKRKQVRTIVTVRSNEGCAELIQLGVEGVINTEEKLLSEEVARLTNGIGVQAAFDAVGGDLGAKVIKSAGVRARLIIYGLLSPEPASFYNSDVVLKLLNIKGFGLDNWLAGSGKEVKERMLAELIEWVQEPGFAMPVASIFPLRQYEQAVHMSRTRQGRGKVLLGNVKF